MSVMGEIRVLIVDDAVLARRMISTALTEEPGIEIVGTAVNGLNAIQKLDRLAPDVIIMDIEMPEMDGIEALKSIKASHPHIAVIMFSSLSPDSSERTVLALELGAEDFVQKPTGVKDVREAQFLIRASLVPKIQALGDKIQHHKETAAEQVERTAEKPRKQQPPVVSSRPSARIAPPTPETPARSMVPEVRRKVSSRPAKAPVEVVAIGVSTGGPNALSRLMPSIPLDIPVPIVIVQHMPASFTKTLANRLNESSKIEVVEAQHGEPLSPGKAWIAPGGFHMVVEREGDEVHLALNEDPPEQGCRPAVDVLFRSVAEVYAEHTLAVILTGMGKDGLVGSEKIIKAGGVLYAQDEESSVVWGMPGAVTRAGLPDKVLHIDRLGYEIMLRINVVSNTV